MDPDEKRPDLASEAARSEAPGLYGPHDLMWRVNRERVLLLAGPRALLLQLAHPLVAAGVAQHDDFRSRPLARLRRTLDAMLGIIFGSAAEAQRHAERVNHLHARVTGVLEVDAGPFARGTPYAALDPQLLFWVQATLLDSARLAYESFIGPLGEDERAQLYAESLRIGPLLRLPRERMPPDLGSFADAFQQMLDGPTLAITPQARALADDVLHPNLPGLPRWVGDLGSILTAGLLPPVLREGFGLRWGPGRERSFTRARRAVRTSLPWLPERVRWVPQERRARRLLA